MTFRELLAELVEAWGKADAQRAAMFFCEDGVYREAEHAPIAGRAAIASHFAKFFRDGPAWRLEVDDVVVEGDRAAVSYRFFIGGDARGWRERAGCAMVQRRDGAIALWREYHG